MDGVENGLGTRVLLVQQGDVSSVTGVQQLLAVQQGYVVPTGTGHTLQACLWERGLQKQPVRARDLLAV